MKNIALLTLACTGLLLASCDRTELPSNLNSVSGTVAEGSLAASSNGALTLTTSAWTGGAGSVRAYTQEGSQPENVVTTALAADGKFNLNLPATPAAGTLSAIATGEFNDEEDDAQGMSWSARARRRVQLWLSGQRARPRAEAFLHCPSRARLTVPGK